ncbi:thioredoxin domain-containing protein [Maricaulis sp.]|uniref:DsbA family protein n=1 Tax=Maricaulis sp. TaxID=1486257 RepID=UPI00263809CA|nr:thioredoxin domain-containing protein [Maricaulis sp.]
MSLSRLVPTALTSAALLLGTAAAGLAQNPAQAERPDDHAIGAADAPLLIVEYASYACPHCAHFQEDAWPAVREEFIETGQVRWVYRPTLTNPIQLAGAGIILAECAAEDRFFDATDLLFAEQAALFEAARSGGDVLGVYNRIGAAVGLNSEAFMACLQDPAMNEAVNAAAIQANEDGIPGTPSFIIGGELLAIVREEGRSIWHWGGEPLMLDGERVPVELNGDSFSRIVLHFLNSSDSEN